jgi:hypothetical protein
MRKALNDNPMIQISVLGVGLILVGFLLFTRMSGGKEKTEVPPNAPIGSTAADTGGATTGALPPGTSPGATSGAVDPAITPPIGGDTGSSTPPVTPAGTVDPQAMSEPGPGLPAPVAKAWQSGDAIALLVVRASGIDDRLVRSSSRQISAMSGVTLFDAPAEKVAKYARITQAVGLNRVPALVVIRPKDVAGAPPQAQVSYGFRDSQSVVQAVRDALYKGKDDVPYYPG